MSVKAPKGLSVNRNGNNFVCKWDLGQHDYSAQEFQYYSDGRWWPFNVDKKAKSFTVKWDPIKSISVFKARVRGKKGKWSGWENASFDVKAPNKPKIKIEYNNEYSDPRTTFSWEVKAENNKHEWFYRVGWQTRLIDNNGETDPPWSSVVYDTNSSGSYIQQEDSTLVFQPGASYTREFKLTAYGPGGRTAAAKEVKYVFARPNVPELTDEEQNEHNCDLTANGRGGYLCEMEWNSYSDENHPLDSQEIQYLITVPRVVDVDNNTEVQIEVPAGQLSWQTAGILYPALEDFEKNNKFLKTVKKRKKKKTKKRLKKTKLKVTKKSETVTIERDDNTTDALDFTIDQLLDSDQVVFVRVVAKRGSSALNTASEAYLCDDDYSLYTMSKPTSVSQELSPSTNRVTVTATNACQIENSFLIVSLRCQDENGNVIDKDIGYITRIDSGTGTFEIPEGVTNYSIGVRAAIGKMDDDPTYDDEKNYQYYLNDQDTNIIWQSSTEWLDGDEMPSPPAADDIKLDHTSQGTIHVNFAWDWKAADSAELSWSTDENAWSSTNGPSTYTIDNLNNGDWDIAGLELGQTYHVRIRLKQTYKETELVSRWSEKKSIFLSAAPAVPTLELSPTFINPGDKFTATWTYISTDTTIQKSAILAVVEDGDYTTIGTADSEQTIAVDSSLGDIMTTWAAGDKKQLAVQVVSESSTASEWSPMASLNIVNPASCHITNTSFETTEETMDVYVDDSGETISETIEFDNVLTELPLSVTVTGAGNTGRTNITIRRFGRFLQPGPDENVFKGYAGEIVYSATYTGESQFVITRNDVRFIGSLDEGASYILTATVEDQYGQTAEDEVLFIVDWDHDATMPQATLSYVVDSDGNIGAKITPTSTAGVETGDVMDIYRLSIDKPQLILSGGDFEESYVDLYPTIGDHGGYRVVFRTYNNDFIDSDGAPAFLNLDFESHAPMYYPETNIITFGDEEVRLEYNVDLSSSWKNDFTETKYLGGSIQGDWGVATSRTSSITANIVTSDLDTIRALRRLAVYTNACHVRTLDGSNYEAHIDVSENIAHQTYYDVEGKINKIVSYTLNITRVDPGDADVMEYDPNEWSDL